MEKSNLPQPVYQADVNQEMKGAYEERCAVVGNFKQQYSPSSNTYNPGTRNHPNFRWSNEPQPQAWCSGPRGCALTRDVLLLDAVRLCTGVPARSTVRREGSAPARCSESDGRIIYGVNEMITEMVLRRLENQGSYDILMNGFSLQSTTTPRKSNKGGVLEGQSRMKISAWWSLIGASRSVGAFNAQACLAGHHCTSRRFISLNETTASGLPTRHRALEHHATYWKVNSDNAIVHFPIRPRMIGRVSMYLMRRPYEDDEYAVVDRWRPRFDTLPPLKEKTLPSNVEVPKLELKPYPRDLNMYS
ncbi:unnamed protein product [Prunus armeniaca]